MSTVAVARWFVLGVWALTAVYFAFSAWRVGAERGRQSEAESGRRVSHASMAGMALEAVAIAIVFLIRSPGDPALFIAWTAAVVALTGGVFAVLAKRALGCNWRVQAVVTDQHQLVTSGPFGVVRHPIYFSLTLMLLSVGLLLSTPLAVAVGLAILILGTEIRVRSEEKLLAARFGEAFEEYRRTVPPAFLPLIR